MKEKICCAILSGGKAERLPDKPFLPLNRKPLIYYAIVAAEKYFSEVLVVAKKEQEKKMKNTIRISKYSRIICDNSTDFSPWNGILATVVNTKADWILLLACDMPFVSRELFDLLISKINQNIDCVIPKTDRLQPLCALYRRSALANARKEGSVTRFADSLKNEVVQIPQEKYFWLFNINTREGLKEAEEIAVKTQDICLEYR